ncbi:MAG: hypothetical protein ABI480_00040 [Chitinophagaceae bacterium]
MKKNLTTIIATLILVFISVAGHAQDEQVSTPKAKWISDKGFWVVEGNVNNALEHTLHFYNNNKVEIYKETVSGVKLKLNKRKTLMQMKSVLENAVIAWEQKQPLNENGKYFIAAIQKQ